MMKKLFGLLMLAQLVFAASSFAGNIFNGYEEIKWGTLFHKVMDAYPKGKLGEYNKEMIYTQDKPDDTIASRLFAFKEGLLTSVSVTFEAKYVKETGIENLKQKYIKLYGKGKASKPSSHMSSIAWENKQTKISFLYVPNRPEMTVLQFEKK
ncbi:hypothetical protein KOM00_14455 [Geomonas sp. Red69]|uniref:DUF3887 domain-containing protein n=1 Tax=Geomonas diazotrophica TaxID=2843197 RepID=A0ABX8JG97_9BACT|nr:MULTISPECIES: hypothetical protein [Geomonas]MBU5637928.1 hypothetical protein [Geomonas diazotrophica]QWV96497.1 hypothetical protein KP005_14095 [Geomonas nitrogeniifigens]